MKNMQKSERTGLTSFLRPVGFACLFGVIVSAVLLLLFAFIMSWRDFPHAAIDPVATFAVAAGSFVAGFICARLMRENGLMFGAICGAIIFALMALCGMVFVGGFGIAALIKLVIVLCSSMLGGVLGVNMHRKRR